MSSAVNSWKDFKCGLVSVLIYTIVVFGAIKGGWDGAVKGKPPKRSSNHQPTKFLWRLIKGGRKCFQRINRRDYFLTSWSFVIANEIFATQSEFGGNAGWNETKRPPVFGCKQLTNTERRRKEHRLVKWSQQGVFFGSCVPFTYYILILSVFSVCSAFTLGDWQK